MSKPSHRYLGWQSRLVLLLLLLSGPLWSWAQAVDYRSQAVYIYKFTKYVSWPAPANGESEFRIGVYGNSPILAELEVMASVKKTPGGQRITVRKMEDPEDVEGLHLVYIASSKSRDLKNILPAVRGKPLLLIGERGGMARKGAAINFLIMENGLLRFEFNSQALEGQRLRVSDELLRLGFEVG